MPAITLSVIPGGIISRSVRATVADVRRRDFVATLESKGVSEKRVLYHVAKNAAPTILAVAGLQTAQLLGLWDTAALTALGGGGVKRFSDLPPAARDRANASSVTC